MNQHKQAAIIAAYGDAWEKVKEHVDENGWCEYMVYPYDLGFDEETAEKDLVGNTVRWRPRPLGGLESNNEWIRVDERLPGHRQVVNICMRGMPRNETLTYLRGDKYFARYYSHWRPVEEIKPPLY